VRNLFEIQSSAVTPQGCDRFRCSTEKTVVQSAKSSWNNTQESNTGCMVGVENSMRTATELARTKKESRRDSAAQVKIRSFG
jgi:hypothetical protein